MAFSRGLFYPWIDIQNEAWLKTAALYWDSIQTIVPCDMQRPYQNDTTQRLYDAGVVEPFLVSPEMTDVSGLAQDVLKYFETAEGLAVLGGQGVDSVRYLHPDKLPQEVHEMVEIHSAKLPQYIRQKFRSTFRQSRRDNWLLVDERFAAFYMTLLATRLSEMHGLGLLTDTGAVDRLALSAKLDARQPPLRPTWHRLRHAGRNSNWEAPPMLAEGMLASLALEQLDIDPETPIERLIRFREQHADELGRFRTSIGSLTAAFADHAIPINHLRQGVEDLYKNEVKPAKSALKKALKGSKIKHFSEQFLKVSCFGLPATALPLTVLNISAPFALLAGAGVSLSIAVALYNVDRERQLMENPYTYLIAAERELSRRLLKKS